MRSGVFKLSSRTHVATKTWGTIWDQLGLQNLSAEFNPLVPCQGS